MLIFEDIRSSAISDAFLTRAAVLWRQAEEAVKDSPAYSYNVRMGAVPVMQALLARKEVKVWVTRTPERFNFMSIPEQRALASELMVRFEEAKNIRISESKQYHDETLGKWRTLVDSLPLPPAEASATTTVEDTLLVLLKRGLWGDTVEDPLANDGSAMKLYNSHYEWCTRLYFWDVAFDHGEKYRLRMRVRVEKKLDQEDGEAFWAGVYDVGNKRSCGNIERKTSQMGDGYEWYDVAEWIPDTAHYFWIGPGRFDKKSGESSIKALYIDKLELSRVEQ